MHHSEKKVGHCKTKFRERGVPCACALLMWGCLLRLPLCQSIEGNAQNFLDDKLKSAAENIYKFLLTITCSSSRYSSKWRQQLIWKSLQTSATHRSISDSKCILAVFQRRNALQQGRSSRGWTTHEANNWRRLSPHRAISHKIGQFCSSLISTSLSLDIVETGWGYEVNRRYRYMHGGDKRIKPLVLRSPLLSFAFPVGQTR